MDGGCVGLAQRRESDDQLSEALWRAVSQVVAVLTPRQEVLVAGHVVHQAEDLLWSVAEGGGGVE